MGEYDNLLAPAEVVNGLTSKGELSGFNQAGIFCTGGGGPWSIRGEDECVTQVVGNTGGGFFTICKAPSGGLGDGTKPPTGERGTSNVLAGTAKVDRPTLVMMAHPNGSRLSMDGGGGRKSAVLLGTGNGKSGMIITEDMVCLFCNGTEFCVFGDGRVSSTKYIVQELRDGGADEVNPRTYKV